MTSKLKEAREKAGYTIEEVSDILKIRKKYIHDLEKGELEDLPGKVYIEGYTKLYHEFLGLKYSQNKVIIVRTPKLNANSKIHKKYIILISTIALSLIISIYAFMGINHLDDSTDNIVIDNENNEATTN